MKLIGKIVPLRRKEEFNTERTKGTIVSGGI